MRNKTFSKPKAQIENKQTYVHPHYKHIDAQNAHKYDIEYVFYVFFFHPLYEKRIKNKI